MTDSRSRTCAFCDRKQIEPLVFYDAPGWCAFLAAPYHTKGHAILAARRPDSACPVTLAPEILRGFDSALATVAAALDAHYHPKRILFASVRGDIQHMHCHLIPLWLEEEREWRRQHVYEKGHLFEFLGDLEKAGDLRAAVERIEHDWSTDVQRAAITAGLRPTVEALRQLTGYVSNRVDG